MYMTVDVDVMPSGINLCMWMSTVEFWMSEVKNYPYKYTYIGNSCTWLLHSNSELTSKMINMIGEQADDICTKQAIKNSTRKLSNR
jgi:hypothetical protein